MSARGAIWRACAFARARDKGARDKVSACKAPSRRGAGAADLLEGAQIPLPATLPRLLQSASYRHPVTLRQERPPAPGELERGRMVTPENLSRPKWLPPKKPDVSSTTLPCLTQTGKGWYLTPLVFACDASREDARRQGRRAWGGVLGSGGLKREEDTGS